MQFSHDSIASAYAFSIRNGAFIPNRNSLGNKTTLNMP